MKVVIYARYSSHNQSECSIEGQLEICRAYAQQNNFDIIGEYIDRATTGTTDNRPQFRKMIEDSEKQLFNGVLVYALDRFARNRYDSAVYKAKLKKSNIKVYSARENISDDPAGVLMESVLEGMAEYFSLELGQKVKRGMNLNAECCFYNGGSVPLGYKLENVYDERFNNNLKKAVKKQYVIDDEKAYIVKKIFEMYANDTRMVDIINYLNGLKLTTSKNNPFNKSSIGRILTNKKYIGIYSYNGIEKEDGIPRIIEDDLFEKVQRELVRNGLAPARSKAKTAYLLTGKLYCGKCKDKMTGTSGTSKTGKLHTYYMCKTAKHSKDLCNMGKVKRKNIEDIVVELAQSLLTSENINQVANKVVEIAHNSQDDTQLKRLQKSLRDEEKRKENTLKAVTVCEDDSTRKSLFDEIGNINENIKNIEKLLIQEESNHILISTSEIKFFLKQLMKGNIQDFKYRKMLINTLINRVYLYKSKIVIVYNINNREQEIEISLIKNIEGSTVDSTALPYVI